VFGLKWEGRGGTYWAYLANETNYPYSNEHKIILHSLKWVSFVMDFSRVYLVEKCHDDKNIKDYREMNTRVDQFVQIIVV
jgi:hypothetical protein